MFGKPIVITDGVFQLRAIGARVTVLAEQDDVILIDTGLSRSLRVINRGLSDLGFSLDRVSRVVITHAHPDHYGGLSELVSAARIRVAVHELEADIVEGRVPAPSPFHSRLLGALTRPALSRLTGGPVTVDLRLRDGDIIPFPTEIRVVHLPGHTPGSIGLHLPQKRTVIVGDALQYKLGWRLYPPAPGVTQCPQEAINSLRKLLSLDFDTICFSHFPPLKKNAKCALRHLVEHHSPTKSLAGVNHGFHTSP